MLSAREGADSRTMDPALQAVAVLDGKVLSHGHRDPRASFIGP